MSIFILKDGYQGVFTERSWADFCALEGEVFKCIQNRRTFRIERQGRGFFIKCHRGVGWREILKNLVTCKLPVLGAGNEWHAIHRLLELGVETMTPVAFGEEGVNPAQQRSFLVTKELVNCISLEHYCEQWRVQPPSVRHKRRLIRHLASIARTLHEHGVNHRDFYLCHFLLQQPWDGSVEDLKLFVIDLHRVQIRKDTPRRWRIKDLAALYFSAQGVGLTQRDILCFLKTYTQGNTSHWLKQGPYILEDIQAKAARLLAKEARKSEKQ